MTRLILSAILVTFSIAACGGDDAAEGDAAPTDPCDRMEAADAAGDPSFTKITTDVSSDALCPDLDVAELNAPDDDDEEEEDDSTEVCTEDKSSVGDLCSLVQSCTDTDAEGQTNTRVVTMNASADGTFTGFMDMTIGTQLGDMTCKYAMEGSVPLE